MSTALRLYRLAVKCPVCGTPPRLRVTEEEIRQKTPWRADAKVQTYQCHRRFPGGRICGTMYEITAEAYQRARKI